MSLKTRGEMVAALSAVLIISGSVMVEELAAQQDFSNVQIEATHVAGAVYMLVGQGGNIAVSSGPDGALMVDDEFAPLAGKIRAALREIGRSEEATDLKFLLNTHWHGDHTGGNVEFGPEATIIAQTNVRKRLSTPQDRGNGNVTPASPDVALPVITFDKSLDVHFNGERISAIHIPHGHTDGDIVIYFTESNVVHMGDDFFSGRFPFVDLSSGGSVEGMLHGVAEVLADLPPDAKVIPGHGPLSTVDDLRLYHRMMEETISTVREEIGAGATLEQIQAAGVSDEWAGWGEGFISTERWLETIYRSLTDAGAGEYERHGHVHGS